MAPPVDLPGCSLLRYCHLLPFALSAVRDRAPHRFTAWARFMDIESGLSDQRFFHLLEDRDQI